MTFLLNTNHHERVSAGNPRECTTRCDEIRDAGGTFLTLDEWGYLPIDRAGAQWLFRVVADSYETRSLILTTNLEFSKWGTVFTDDQMTTAMIDRLAHHGHLLLFEGECYRMQNALMKER